MVIIFKSDKSLVVTSKSTIIQKENLADKLKFYIPKVYEDNDLSLFTVTMYYKDGGNAVYSETLIANESDKDNYLLFTLPLTTEITEVAGTVTLWLVLSCNSDIGSGAATLTEIHSEKVSFEIEKWDEYKLYSETSAKVQALESKISSLESEIEQLKALVTVSA